MKLNELIDPRPIALIGADAELVREIQTLLSVHGYLDPPADGKFGPVSHWALVEFAYRSGLSTGQGLTRALAQALLDTGTMTLPAIRQTGGWFDKVIDYMHAKEYWICRHPLAVNIVYLEGADADGTINNNKPNVFNDLRIVFTIDSIGMPVFQTWEGTTEPGRYWTIHPMDAGGAARIALAQFKAWVVGTHHPGKPAAHEALVQAEPVLVYRDLDQNYKRDSDKTDFGVFGINQHWGYDAPKNDLGNTSAGCLVGRTKAGHRQFMANVKSDPRFAANGAYRFVTAIMPGADVLGA